MCDCVYGLCEIIRQGTVFVVSGVGVCGWPNQVVGSKYIEVKCHLRPD